ncbi:hypothetical protein BaRGS_00007937 [Batillaria attramentaria]|uniref:HIG1 domain-containing protein n=1 Tax=Batillaria attramentaria TaxID=370345 RepID=A0ABD0LMK6_9CAEN
MATPPGSENAMGTEDFTYLPPPRPPMYREEGVKEKFIRKTKENPFVPIGVAVTTFALTFGLIQMKTGNKRMSQKMMRLRIAGQGFTVMAVLMGVAYGTSGKKR